MNYQVVGTEIDPAEVQNGEWETILRLRNRYRPATASQSPQHSAGLLPEPNDGDGRPTEKSRHATPLTRFRRAPLPQLPRGDLKVVVRPRGGFDVSKETPRRLFTAICAATKIPLQEALAQDQVRLHPANNTFTISTPVEARARTYAQITSITIGTNSTDATAYLAPPDDAVRGVIHMAHSGESHAEIINGLVPFNPELPIIDARSFGKKRSIIITFATGPLPKAIRFWAGVHTCFPHRPKMETCYNCRRIGHRQDVCPAPASGCCHNCGETHTPTDPPTCPPKCIVCGDGHHTGNIQCKYRYARPQPRTTQPATGHQSRTREQTPAPRKSSRSASSARSASRDRSNKPRQDLTWADRVRKSPPASTQKIPDHNEGELRALREEVSRLTALTQRSLASPTLSLSTSPPTLTQTNTAPPQSPPSKKQRITPSPPASGPTDVDSKLKELSDQFDKKLKNLEIRLESNFNALLSDLTTKLETHIERCMESILQKMVGLLEARLTQLPPLSTPLLPTAQPTAIEPHIPIDTRLAPLIHPPTLQYGGTGQHARPCSFYFLHFPQRPKSFFSKILPLRPHSPVTTPHTLTPQTHPGHPHLCTTPCVITEIIHHTHTLPSIFIANIYHPPSKPMATLESLLRELHRLPPRHTYMTHKLINWDALRTTRTASPDNPITDINDWVDSLQTDIQHHTQQIETTTDVPTLDSRLAHLWEAYHSLLERWKRDCPQNGRGSSSDTSSIRRKQKTPPSTMSPGSYTHT
ncbi:hypothetical protein HPB49_005039 [Dermacentor silvarum]|uniref:Uncharacterized protein n=1 Tax=Dermacentor silvarum TaxID=543639 RepID=A0ACB8DN37_DERSI|nr:hypothetical protein HPB49_005039 [Dermacentor silvarum]